MANENSGQRSNLALVLSGGGARGAYEAGVIHYIRTKLPHEFSRKRRFDILCGSSVGAINTCLLASMAHDLVHQGNHIYEVWKNLKQENVYKRDMVSLAGLLTRSFLGITRNIFSRSQDEDVPALKKKHFRGLLNATPLIPFLKKEVPWKQISVNIRNQLIKAVSVTATNVHTGNLELFVEKHPSVPYTGRYVFHDTKLEFHHALASAALPLIFQSVHIGNSYYVDGGLRLNTPMSPAIQLGADKILVIGLHHKKESPEEEDEKTFIHMAEPPTIGLLLGKISSALFLDRLDYDIEQMERINRIIDWGEKVYGADFVDKINDYLKKESITGDVATRGLKKLSAFRIYPSRDLRNVFGECIEGQKFFSKRLTSFERTLLKVLDIDIHQGKDFLSFIMFVPEYMNRLLELGYEDAQAKHDELAAFLST